jgi:CRP/FNR family transcriptional regulator, cyclic AMP receptor protein
MTLDALSRPRAATDGAPRELGVRLLAELDDMAAAIPAEDRAMARRTVISPLRKLEPGPLSPGAFDGPRHPFAAIVLEGIVFRETRLRGRTTIEILTPGDIFALCAEDDPWRGSIESDYVVHRTARVAILDDRFRVMARRWPGLHDAVYSQLARQAQRCARVLAILHLPRVDDRIVAFFSDLADRLGRVTPDGIRVDLALTHEQLGEAVGGRRPTVTLALAELAASGRLLRLRDGTWLIPQPSASAA